MPLVTESESKAGFVSLPSSTTRVTGSAPTPDTGDGEDTLGRTADEVALEETLESVVPKLMLGWVAAVLTTAGFLVEPVAGEVVLSFVVNGWNKLSDPPINAQ